MLDLETPLIVAVVTPQTLDSDIEAVRHAMADVIEFRADLQNSHDADVFAEQLDILRQQCDVPVLFTLRDRSEGGTYDGPNDERESLYRSVLPHVDAIDIEAVNLAVYEKLREEVRAREITVILSSHNFETTPPAAELEHIVACTETARADVLKIATMCATVADALNLLALPARFPGRKIAIVGMGPMGKPVRAVAAAFGSVLGYASVTEAVASGQLSVKELYTVWQICNDR